MRDKKRCVVVADGFFEWKQGSNSKSKLAHFVKPKKGKLMMMAGLWDKAECATRSLLRRSRRC